MKYLYGLIGIALLLGAGFFIGKTWNGNNESKPTWNDDPIKKVHKHVTLEVTRNWSKTIKDDKGPGVGIIEYEWHFTYMFGFDFPSDWDWEISRDDKGVLTLSVPPLKQLNEPLFAIDNYTEFNQANGNRQQRMLKEIKAIGLTSIDEGSKALLDNKYIVENALSHYSKNLLDLINQANPNNLTHSIVINIKK